MNCKTCGYPLTGNDLFCKNCGTSVNNVNLSNNEVINATPIIQPANVQQASNSNVQPEIAAGMNFIQQPANVQQEPNSNVQPEIATGMNFIQQPTNVQQQNSTTNIQPQHINTIPTPQPVNSSPILEQNTTLNTIPQQVNAGQELNSNQQNINNIKLDPKQNNSIQSDTNKNLNTTQQQEQIKPKNNNSKFILIGVALVLLIAVLSVYGIKKILNKEQLTEDKDQQVVNKTSNYTVKYNGFTFKIPTNLIYQEEEGMLAITDEEDTKVAYIDVLEGLYSQLVTNKNLLQVSYQEQGYTADAAKEETIGNTPFITMQLSASGNNILLGLTKANSMNIFVVSIFNLNNEYDYDFLETIANILTSTEYTGETNAISSFSKVDTSIISDLIKEQE